MSVTDRHLPHARRLLAVAALAFLALPAQALNVSQQGLGQVLLFPYYTVKNGYDTLLSVTNTSASTVVARVRFREALNGREVAAFNVVLDAHDVWTGAATSNAAGDGALLRTFDRSCTAPAFASGSNPAARELAFSKAAYTDTPPHASDGASQSLDRVREGYVEVIAMGEFAGNATGVPVWAYHDALGEPADCARVASSVAADYAGLLPPRDVLRGSATLIQVANGIAIDAPATHIEGFSDRQALWFPADSPHPDLADGDAAEPAIYSHDGNDYADPISTNSADTISALLMATAVTNEFAADGVGSMTSWVLTYPTKRHYTDGVSPAKAPFSQTFQDAGKSCDLIDFRLFNRETVVPQPPQNCGTCPTGSSIYLCHASNLVDFNGGRLFSIGENRLNAHTESVGTAGWLSVLLTATLGINGNHVSVGNGGLPVIGFAAFVRNNAAEAGNNRNYGSTVTHRTFRD